MMSGIDLINNLIDELTRARDLCMTIMNQEEINNSTVEDLITDIHLDIERYYDYSDSINLLLSDIEVE